MTSYPRSKGVRRLFVEWLDKVTVRSNWIGKAVIFPRALYPQVRSRGYTYISKLATLLTRA